MLKEFKEFIARGNVVDLAVGVIIGGAFSKIVTSLVDNIFGPIIGMILGGVDFSNLAIKLGSAKILYGVFIQNIIDFLITALCLFIVIKIMNKFNSDLHKIGKKGKKTEEEEEILPPKPADIVLLEEIRDLLKENKKGGKKK